MLKFKVWLHRIVQIFLPFFFALFGFFYAIRKSIASTEKEIDFKYIWYAGRMWIEGKNPYGIEFVKGAAEVFVGTNVVTNWCYPPNWWIISVIMGTFPMHNSLFFWRTLNFLFLIVGCGFLYRSMLKLTPDLKRTTVLFVFGYCTTMQATAMAFSMGQTSILCFLGICILIYGITYNITWIKILGFCIICLKPQIGYFCLIGLIVYRQPKRIWTLGLLASLLVALPAFFVGYFSETLIGFLTGLFHYSSLRINSPEETTGFQHLAKILFGISITVPVLVFMGTAFMIVQARAILKIAEKAKTSIVTYWDYILLFSLSTVCFFLPMHSYDIILLTPALYVVMGSERISLRIGVGATFILLWRASNIAKTLGFHDNNTLTFVGSGIESLAILFLFMFTLLRFILDSLKIFHKTGHKK